MTKNRYIYHPYVSGGSTKSQTVAELSLGHAHNKFRRLGWFRCSKPQERKQERVGLGSSSGSSL